MGAVQQEPVLDGLPPDVAGLVLHHLGERVCYWQRAGARVSHRVRAVCLCCVPLGVLFPQHPQQLASHSDVQQQQPRAAQTAR
jgi:hypothetical protein